MFDIDDIVAAHDSDYINGQKHMFSTPNSDYDDKETEQSGDPDELFTVGIYDVNGKPFYTDVTDEEFTELNAEDSPFKWVKVSNVIGKRMYYFGHEITLKETRKHA